ncbi:SHOCT domain-containing protein [Gordonia sp. SL306]|uniref:SHOCT domain-containing protein n=1 Tax=Gordonia sp. SL306 TaxID=2995145 RepID=UPI00226F536C|nr:SHOCT domain-containing protein [Gordonia sp. SL306]WAC53750.1 SHOCT domain-containing protein [Gordonia sp. SL306]
MWDSFWDFIWYTIVIFAFVAYLMVLWFIITDLFRDKKASGWLKAVWVVFLIILPYITAIVYLLVKGRGMSERQAEAAQQAKQATDSYIQSVAGKSPAEHIADAKGLLDAGTITQEEFDALKAKALS